MQKHYKQRKRRINSRLLICPTLSTEPTLSTKFLLFSFDREWRSIVCFPTFSFCLKSVRTTAYHRRPSPLKKKKKKNGEGSWFIPQTKFPLFLFQGYVPKTNTKENQTNKLTKKKNKTEWWKLVTKEHEHFNKVLATKVLNKSFFKIQNQTVLVSCYFPRRRWNEKPSTNTDTQVHCLGSNLLKGSDGFAFVSKAIIFTKENGKLF